MRLNITNIRAHDYGEYHCISKNEMGVAKAIFHVQGKRMRWIFKVISITSILSRSIEKSPYIIRGDIETQPIVFGAKIPERESYEDICGPPQTCPECHETK